MRWQLFILTNCNVFSCSWLFCRRFLCVQWNFIFKFWIFFSLKGTIALAWLLLIRESCGAFKQVSSTFMHCCSSVFAFVLVWRISWWSSKRVGGYVIAKSKCFSLSFAAEWRWHDDGLKMNCARYRFLIVSQWFFHKFRDFHWKFRVFAHFTFNGYRNERRKQNIK